MNIRKCSIHNIKDIKQKKALNISRTAAIKSFGMFVKYTSTLHNNTYARQ